jgi:hypothetical protein
MNDRDLEKLLNAFAADSASEDVLIAELDRRFEAAKAAGTLPNTDAPFERFMKRLNAVSRSPAAGVETVAVVFRRYMMATGTQVADVMRVYNLSGDLVSSLLSLRVPFVPQEVADLAARLAGQFGERAPAVNVLLKELAAHHFARVARAPLLLAARKRTPS